jgi:hypothetical protein
MKIQPFALLAAAAVGLAVQSWAAPKPAAPVAPDDVDYNVPATSAPGLLGTYVGAFGSNKITVCLQKVIGSTVNGYSVVAGNERAFSGSIKSGADGSFEIVAREPGDHPEDGVFTFNYQTGGNSLAGSWAPNNAKRLQKKIFNLSRRDFAYNPKAGRFTQSSTRLLKEGDVENYSAGELRIMRNEIYARHGYSFRMKDMRSYFDEQDWYMPVSTDVTSKLTAVEEKNAALIKRYEKYSSEYYDSFGR